MKPALLLVTFMACIMTSLAQPQQIIRDADLGSVSYSWTKDTVYFLEGYVFLEAGGTLTIEAGTVIKAIEQPSTGDPTSALIISQGAQIIANGSYMNPIIFTSEQDNIDDPNDLVQTDRGLWGGLVLLGDAPVINNQGESITITHSYFATNELRGQFGGTNLNQNSGVVNNVSIRFSGANLLDQKFAGLTLAGVGQETYVDTVEVFASGGDGFRFEGGQVDTRHLSASFCGDDAFDWDLGYIGRGQYWFSIQSEDQADCGIEGKGNFSKPILYNITLLGSGQKSTADNPVAIRFSEGSGGILGMSIFSDFPNAGIEVEDLAGSDDSYAKVQTGELQIIANVWSNFGQGNSFSVDSIINASDTGDPLATDLRNHLIDSNRIIKNYLPLISRSQNMRLNPDYFNDGTFHEFEYFSYPADTFFIQQTFICQDGGAFQTVGAWWLRYWTALDQDNYLMHPCIPSFFNILDPFIPGDTLTLSCEAVDSLPLDVTYRCINSFCSLLNQSLAISMRMKRKKRRIDMIFADYCYVQPLAFEGIETLAIYSDNGLIDSFITLDTFEVPFTVLVTDEISPTFSVIPCDTCTDQTFMASIEDCDSAWITSYDSINVNDTLVEYQWEGIDRCGNFADFRITKNTNAESKTWYEDMDGDGYGTNDVSFQFQGIPPGYSLLAGDCDDMNPLKNPGVNEDPLDNFDNDCDGKGEYEQCEGSELLAISEDCNPVQFNWNPAKLELNSGLATCQARFQAFDGDIWFTLITPPSGEITIDYNSDIGITDIHLYRGSCQDPQLLDCALFGDTDVFADNLIPGETLYLQLTAWNGTQGQFSLCATSPGSTGQDALFSTLSNLRIYPNPSPGFQNVEWEMIKRSQCSMYVFNTLGMEVQTIFQQEIFNPGKHLIALDLSKLETGAYWIMLYTDQGQYVVKSSIF